jgi:hypothetical protein
MLCKLFIGLAVGSAAALAEAKPAMRGGVLEVRTMQGGIPCFSLAREQERRTGAPDFHAITVTPLDTPRSPSWSMAMPPERTFAVTNLVCIPYAGRLAVLPQTPADPLLQGKVYEVLIEARGQRLPDMPRSYRARFCVGHQGPLAPVAGAKGRWNCPG